MEAFDTSISGVSGLKVATIKELFDDSEDKSRLEFKSASLPFMLVSSRVMDASALG